jgi:putative transposase
MAPSFPQRRRPHHDVRPASDRPTIIFLTVCTKNRRPILANEATHGALVEVWSSAMAWLVGQYVVMPDHVHLFATPGPEPLELGKWISFWKSRLARRLGPGVWQEGYWDRTLRAEENYAEKCAYVRDNPVRKGLVDQASHWPFAGILNEWNW